jgi:hypothetical protein
VRTTANKALVGRFYDEVWNPGNLDACFEQFTDDWVQHDLRPTQALPPEGMVASARKLIPYEIWCISETAIPLLCMYRKVQLQH